MSNQSIRISPSQIKLWRRCKRKWSFKYINRLKEPVTVKQQFGTDGHKHMENWIKEGAPPPDTPEGNTARQIIRSGWVPPPGPHLEPWVEKYISIPIPEVHPKAVIIGYSDLIVPPDLVETRPVVIDYKFTSSLRWAMTEEQAAEDPQSIIYTEFAVREFNTQSAITRFLYAVASNPKVGLRKPAGSKKVEVEFERGGGKFEKGWNRILSDAAEICEAKETLKDANDAPYNVQACSDFGGCPFAEQCKIPKGGRIASITASNEVLSECDNYDTFNPPGAGERKDTDMNLMEKLKARKQAATAPPTQGAPPAQGTLMDRLKDMAKKDGVNPPPTEVVATPQEAKDAMNAASDWERGEQGVPRADVSGEYFDQLKAMNIKDLKTIAKGLHIKNFSAMSKDVLVAALMGATTQEEASDTISVSTDGKNKFDGETQEQLHNAATLSTAADKAETNGTDGLMVLFDCAPRKIPDGGNVENLADWMSAVTAKVAADNEVSHFGLIDWAKGGPILAAALEEVLTTDPPQGTVLVDSYSLEGRAVKDVLIRYATIVIQGVR